MKKIVVLSLVSYSMLFALFGPHASIASYNSGSNDETCVYCHTPHASGNAVGATPLWNKPTTNLERTSGFKMYGSTGVNTSGETMAGTPTTQQPQSASLACLSCHDGVSAMNSVINAPGSGRIDSVDGILIGELDPKYIRSDIALTVGLDGNLMDDHPISLEYVEGKGSLKSTSTNLTDFYNATTIDDLLRNGKVECVSCHDPHGTPYGLYVRAQRSTSKICLACHNK